MVIRDFEFMQSVSMEEIWSLEILALENMV